MSLVKQAAVTYSNKVYQFNHKSVTVEVRGSVVSYSVTVVCCPLFMLILLVTMEITRGPDPIK